MACFGGDGIGTVGKGEMMHKRRRRHRLSLPAQHSRCQLMSCCWAREMRGPKRCTGLPVGEWMAKWIGGEVLTGLRECVREMVGFLGAKVYQERTTFSWFPIGKRVGHG